MTAVSKRMSGAAALSFVVVVTVSLQVVIDAVSVRNQICSQFYHVRKVANGFQEHRIQCENVLSLTTGNDTLSYVELSDGSSIVRGISGGRNNNRLMVFEAVQNRSDVEDFCRRFAAASPGTDASSCASSGSICVNVTGVGYHNILDHGMVDMKVECDRASSALNFAIEETKNKRAERYSASRDEDHTKIPISESIRMLQQLLVTLREKQPSHAAVRKQPARNEASDARRHRPRRQVGNLLFPGTRWCGVGNISTEEDSVGAIVPVDKCCQEHDNCEHTIDGFSTKYNLYNFRFHTLSHCECDDRFRTCLRALSNSHADEIGRWYFNYIGMRCFIFRRERVCAQRTWWGQCTKYIFQPTAVVHDSQLTY